MLKRPEAISTLHRQATDGMRFEILYAIEIIARVCAGALTKGDV
jgi:hypothetical protein